jgi:hypothetical protein
MEEEEKGYFVFFERAVGPKGKARLTRVTHFGKLQAKFAIMLSKSPSAEKRIMPGITKRSEYRHRLLQTFPQDIRHLIPVRHVERIARLDSSAQEELWRRLRSGQPLATALAELGVEIASSGGKKAEAEGSMTRVASGESPGEARPEGMTRVSFSEKAVGELLLEIFPGLDPVFATSFVTVPPLDRLVAVYEDLDTAIGELRGVAHGLIGLLGVVRHYEEKILEIVGAHSSLQLVFSQSTLSKPSDAPDQTLFGYIEEAHRLLDRLVGEVANDRSARNLVFRINDILNTRKETLT